MSNPDQAGCAADGHVLTRAFPSRSYFGPGDRADGGLTRRDQIVTVTGPMTSGYPDVVGNGSRHDGRDGRTGALCPTCNQTMSLTGICDNCA